jgi:hypothetical protein
MLIWSCEGGGLAQKIKFSMETNSELIKSQFKKYDGLDKLNSLLIKV